MGRQPVVSLAASARDWSDRFHRFLLDHGGGVVAGRVMTAEQALTLEADALLIDDVCSFLTTRLVMSMRQEGRAIIGMFDAEDGPDAKRRLLEVGISDVIDAGAPAEEFLAVVNGAVSHVVDIPKPPSPSAAGGGMIIGVTGPPGGVGVTEVSIGLALALSSHDESVLADFNQSWPALGQRLGLDVYPNLSSAVDLALHEPDRVNDGFHAFGSMAVISGLVDPGADGLPAADLVALVSALSDRFAFVVLDLGPVTQWGSDVLLKRLSALLIVGNADPVGITRLTRVVRSVGVDTNGTEVAVVVNRVDRASRRRDEIAEHITNQLGGVPHVMVPEDGRIERAAWDGAVPRRGSFRSRMKRLARVLAEARV